MCDGAMVTPSVVPYGYSIPVGGVGVGWTGGSGDDNGGAGRGLEEGDGGKR